MEVAIVAAVARNGVIGVDGAMPWELPGDLAHFKRTTVGHPVIMGRRTYESIAARLSGPLPDRTNIVLSRRGPDLPDAVVVAASIEAALEAARATGSDVAYVVGGGTVYEQFLPLADRLVLTEVDATPAGDTRFPDWDRDAWVEVERTPEDGYAFVEYERRA
jgi:dihydrofolate reductase